MGQMIERAVQRTGFPCSQLASRLGISRTTLYRYFKEESPKEWFVNAMKEIIDPASGTMTRLPSEDVGSKERIARLMEEYIALMEEQGHLMRDCFRLWYAVHKWPEIKVEIENFVANFCTQNGGIYDVFPLKKARRITGPNS
jgi:AcrR family transcriptional regulator